MLLSRLKLVGVCLAVLLGGLATAATGLLPARPLAAREAEPPSAPAPKINLPARPPSPSDPDLQGVWSLEEIERDGKRARVEQGSVILVVTHRFMIWKERDEDRAFVYTVGAGKDAKTIDLKSIAEGQGGSRKNLGIYRAQGQRLLVCEATGARPKDFSAGPGSGATLYRYRRVPLLPAKAPSAPKQEPPKAAPTAMWANKLFLAQGPTSHDFGRVAPGAQPVHRFALKNIYTVPLEITAVRFSCGCASAEPSARRLLPGEVGEVAVTLDTRRCRGRKTATIYLTFGPQYVSTATLQVTADSREE